MTRRISCFFRFIFLFAAFYLFGISLCVAETAEKGTQYVLPKNVYVGDTAEIRYVFRSDINLLSDELDSASSYLELITDFRTFMKMSDKCLVKKASISRVGTEYTLTLEVVAWADIDFPPFDLGALIYFSKESVSSPVFWINLEPIPVSSIAEKNSVTAFLPPEAPLLLPGTKLIIIVLSILFLAVLFFVIFSLAHIPIISEVIANILANLTMKRNAAVAVRKFKKLMKNSAKFDDPSFAGEFQRILREFLSSHFNEDFSSATTSDFAVSFQKIFFDDVPIEFERFVDIFSRIDYIRFAHGQVDSEFQNTQETDERKNLVDEVIFTISAIGREGVRNEDDESKLQSGGLS